MNPLSRRKSEPNPFRDFFRHLPHHLRARFVEDFVSDDQEAKNRLEQLDVACDAFVRYACGGDQYLGREIQSLMAAHEGPPKLLSTSTHVHRILRPPDEGDCLHYGRFLLYQRIGSGSIGTVYRALDRHNKDIVAIKFLHCGDPELVVRLKNEFRSVCNVFHPNLVRMGELFSDGGFHFFTMEYVEGADFLTHVRHNHSYDLPRIIPAFVQLCEAVATLHHKNLLHRDIKPSNVLVTATGRVVVLDFSIVRKLSPQGGIPTFAGTPSYMAPEQLKHGYVLSKATDWFAVGVMLYEALTGRHPFTGQQHRSESSGSKELLIRKPQAWNPLVPDYLDSLCTRLLATDPQERPQAVELLQTLRKHTNASAQQIVPPATSEPFIGRVEQLETLRHLFLQAVNGRPAIAALAGHSGIGKTTCVEHFLGQLHADNPTALIFEGSCYPGERTAFKALDGVVTDITKHLHTLASDELAAVLPRDPHMIARVFPALWHSLGIRCQRSSSEASATPEDRRRAFRSLVDLLGRLGQNRPVVVFIDDLQWGDLDSASFFTYFLSSPEPPSVLLILSYRSEDAHSSPFLKQCGAALANPPLPFVGGLIDLHGLAPKDCEALAAQLLSNALSETKPYAEAVARQSNGNPFLVHLLTQGPTFLAGSLESHAPPRRMTDLLVTCLAGLPSTSLQLLKSVSVAGHPLSADIARTAAGIAQEFPTAVSHLCSLRLLRIRDADKSEIDVYHDTIRDTVDQLITTEERKELHTRLAFAFEQALNPTPSVLAIHFASANMHEQAARYSVQAAEDAFNALAFDRAAHFYRQALKSSIRSSNNLATLYGKLGAVLAAGGRGLEAAEAYTDAAKRAPSQPTHVDYLRLAADQYLRTGRIRDGITILRTLARAVGIQVVDRRWRNVLLLVCRRARLWMARLRSKHARRIGPPAPEELARLDAYWSLVIGFTMVDTVTAASFHARHLMLALKVAEPHRLGLSLAMEAGFSSVRGEATYKSSQDILRRCTAIALEHEDAHVLGIANTTGATSAVMTGRWRMAVELATRAEHLLRSECTGVAWELTTSRVFYFIGLAWMGEWKTFSQEFPSSLRDAHDRGDLYSTTQLLLQTPSSWIGLAENGPDETQKRVERAIVTWRKETGRHRDLPHFFSLVHLAEVQRYRGEPAWQILNHEWAWLHRMLQIVRSEHLSTFARQQLGQTALAEALLCLGSRRERLLATADYCADYMAGVALAWGPAAAHLLRAGICSVRGEWDACRRFSALAEAGFDFADMGMHKAASRYCRGAVTGRDIGLQLRESAREHMLRQGVSIPEHIVRVLAPGCWEARSV